DVGEDSAAAVVFGLDGCVDARASLEGLAIGMDFHARFAAGVDRGGDAFDSERLVAGEAERFAILSVDELEWKNAHADEVRAMDALETFGDDGADAEEQDAFRGPVARGAAAVLLAGDDDEVDAVGLIFDRGVVDRHFFVRRKMRGPAAFSSGGELVAEADIGEGSADHHFVI